MGVRLILRSELGKMTIDEKCPELLPAIAQDERSKCKNSLAAINGPSHAWLFHSGTDEILTGGFNDTTSDREVVLLQFKVIHSPSVALEVLELCFNFRVLFRFAPPVSHGPNDLESAIGIFLQDGPVFFIPGLCIWWIFEKQFGQLWEMLADVEEINYMNRIGVFFTKK